MSVQEDPAVAGAAVPGASRVTIVDVARHLGLSVATVSRAINGRHGVAPTTAARVRRAVKELGFAPQVAAQRLQGGRSRAISLLFPTDMASVEAYDVEFVLGAATATGERDFFFNLHLEALDSDGLLALYRGGLIDGVVLMQVLLDDPRVEVLLANDLPFTMIGRTRDAQATNWVDFDFDGAMHASVAHLAGLGHGVVGLLGRPPAQVRAGLGSAVRLEEAFTTACDEHGVRALVVASDLDRTSSMHAATRLVRGPERPTAVVATHVQAAAAMQRLARDLGWSVPGDLSLVAVGTDRVLDLLEPAPSVVPFPVHDLGYRAASMLIDRIESGDGDGPLDHLLLPAELTLRGTSGPPSDRIEGSAP